MESAGNGKLALVSNPAYKCAATTSAETAVMKLPALTAERDASCRGSLSALY